MRRPRHPVGVLEDEALQPRNVLFKQGHAALVAIDDSLREPVAAQGRFCLAVLVPRLALALDRGVVRVAEADGARGREGRGAHDFGRPG